MTSTMFTRASGTAAHPYMSLRQQLCRGCGLPIVPRRLCSREKVRDGTHAYRVQEYTETPYDQTLRTWCTQQGTPPPYIHTCTHARTHARILAPWLSTTETWRTHAYTHSHRHTRAHILIFYRHSCVYTYTHVSSRGQRWIYRMVDCTSIDGSSPELVRLGRLVLPTPVAEWGPAGHNRPPRPADL